jgi:hypothetical protein
MPGARIRSTATSPTPRGAPGGAARAAWVAWGEGTTPVAADGARGTRSSTRDWITVKEVDEDVSPWMGVDFPLGAIYHLAFFAPSGARYSVLCTSADGSGSFNADL